MNMTYSRHLMALPAVSFALISVSSLNAATLAAYDMENSLNRTLSSTTAVGMTATGFSGSSLASFGAVQKPTGDYYTTFITTAGGGSTVGDALVSGGAATGQYMQFTIAPTVGNTLSLDSLSFDIFAATGGPSDRQIYVFSSKTGFAAGDVLFTGSTATGSANLIPYNAVSVGQNFSIDLSSLADVTDSISFRIYFQTPNAAQGMPIDDITVIGTVVPEPSGCAFLGLSLLSLLRRRRA